MRGTSGLRSASSWVGKEIQRTPAGPAALAAAAGRRPAGNRAAEGGNGNGRGGLANAGNAVGEWGRMEANERAVSFGPEPEHTREHRDDCRRIDRTKTRFSKRAITGRQPGVAIANIHRRIKGYAGGGVADVCGCVNRRRRRIVSRPSLRLRV
ncbi:hypothetical protein BC628DRAFT_13579 [Trametes gibbosa]|nr:hypothetical protein BC628DRAFT_13579 [Trametes gibbosa]